VKQSAAPLRSKDGSRGTAPCPICHDPGAALCRRGRDRLFGLARGLFALHRCPECGCVFQHPLPDDSVLAGYYPQGYWWSEGPQAGGTVARLLRRLERIYREFVVADHVRFLESCCRKKSAGERLLLDIGCGAGTFLHVARSRGFVPHGMDASARAVEVAGKQYGYPVRQGEIGSGVWDGYRFDFITMFHILEHLPDPRQGLRFAGRLLKPTGTLIVQVPNVSSVQARLFGSRWYGLDVPRHVINFSPKALGLLLKEEGYEFQLVSRFSLRDNPASIASSMVPWLDPIGRKGRKLDTRPVFDGVHEVAYLGVFLLALLPAFIESALGLGGTIWAFGRPKATGA